MKINLNGKLVGQKVMVREMTEADADYIVSWRNDPDIRKWMFNQNLLTVKDHLEWFRKEKPNRVDLVVCDKESLKPIGTISFTKITKGSAEAGIMIGDKNYWGKGYAKDALLARLKLGFETLKLSSIYVKIMAENVRIIKLNKRSGFRITGRKQKEIGQSKVVDVLKMELTKDEYYERYK